MFFIVNVANYVVFYMVVENTPICPMTTLSSYQCCYIDYKSKKLRIFDIFSRPPPPIKKWPQNGHF